MDTLLFLAAVLIIFRGSAYSQGIETLSAKGSAQFDGQSLNSQTPLAFNFEDKIGAPMSLGDLAVILSRDPATMDALTKALLNKAGDFGQYWNSPERRSKIEQALRNPNKSDINHFPILTVPELSAAAKALAGNSSPVSEPTIPAQETLQLTGLPKTPTRDEFFKNLGSNLERGDYPIEGMVSAYGDNLAIAKVLNALASNDPKSPAYTLSFEGRSFTSITGFLQYLAASGTSVTANDKRFYANFGHLWYDQSGARRPVTTPTYVDTGLVLKSGRKLIVPVAHSEISIVLRGKVNADLAFYFGIDGGADFRDDSASNQAWVGGRTVRQYQGTEAIAILERAGLVRRGLNEKAKAAGLPLGGYGPLGDCNDIDTMITGAASYPLLREAKYYTGNSELDALSNSVPYDLTDKLDPRRVIESSPFTNPRDIPFPQARAAILELQTTLPKPQ